jgi:hypothetical protein
MDNQILLSNDLKNMSNTYALGVNYPNPFNPTTSIPFSVYKSAEVYLSVYDLNGRLIESLLNERVDAGNHTYEWNASEYHSGLYFIKIKFNDLIQTRKVMLVK